jgi:hypothetical protein
MGEDRPDEAQRFRRCTAPLLDKLAKIKSEDVVLPTQSTDGSPARPVRLRCVTTPDAAQKVLLHRLGITLPTGLRRFDEPTQM